MKTVSIEGENYSLEVIENNIVLFDSALRCKEYIDGLEDLRSRGVELIGSYATGELDYSEAELQQYVEDNIEDFVHENLKHFTKCEE